MQNLDTNFIAPQIIGQHRTFGSLGVTYKILEPVKPVGNNDWLIRIQVLESGEITEYPYIQLINDPEAL